MKVATGHTGQANKKTIDKLPLQSVRMCEWWRVTLQQLDSWMTKRNCVISYVVNRILQQKMKLKWKQKKKLKKKSQQQRQTTRREHRKHVIRRYRKNAKGNSSTPANTHTKAMQQKRQQKQQRKWHKCFIYNSRYCCCCCCWRCCNWPFVSVGFLFVAAVIKITHAHTHTHTLALLRHTKGEMTRVRARRPEKNLLGGAGKCNCKHNTKKQRPNENICSDSSWSVQTYVCVCVW